MKLEACKALRMALIRTARPGDVEQVLLLWDRAAGPTRLPGDAPAVLRLLERDDDALLIAEERGEIVATLIVGWDGWRCHLYRMAVRDDFRRRGLATDLLDHAREHARRLGARRLDAMVDADNEAGSRFWAANGFVDGASQDHRWTSPVAAVTRGQ
jgi:ribosomal protein S18 acetylase RimI-like enzyme